MGLVASCLSRPSRPPKPKTNRRPNTSVQISHPFALQPTHGSGSDHSNGYFNDNGNGDGNENGNGHGHGHGRLERRSTRSIGSMKPFSANTPPVRTLGRGHAAVHRNVVALVDGLATGNGRRANLPGHGVSNGRSDLPPSDNMAFDGKPYLDLRPLGPSGDHYNQLSVQNTRQKSVSSDPTAITTQPSVYPGQPRPSRPRPLSHRSRPGSDRPSSAYSLLPPISPLTPMSSNLEVWRIHPHPRPRPLSFALNELDSQLHDLHDLHDLQYISSTTRLAGPSASTSHSNLPEPQITGPFEGDGPSTFLEEAGNTRPRPRQSTGPPPTIATVPLIYPPPAVHLADSPTRPSPITSLRSLRSARSGSSSTRTYKSKNKLKKVLRVEGDWEVVRDGDGDLDTRGQYDGPVAPMPLVLSSGSYRSGRNHSESLRWAEGRI